MPSPKEPWPKFPDDRVWDNLTLNPPTTDEQLDADWSVVQGKEVERTVARMPQEKLREFVLDHLSGNIFTSAQVRDQSLLDVIFMPLGLGALASFSEAAVRDIGLIWAYMNETVGNRSINGYPFFGACRFMHKDDWAKAYAAILREQNRLKSIEV